MKTISALLLFLASLMTGQLLTVNNLKHLSQTSTEHLDAKLEGHFDLLRLKDQEEKNIRVYSNNRFSQAEFMVLTVFIKENNCHVLSVVSHLEPEIETLEKELISNNFLSEKKMTHEGDSYATVYKKDQFSVVIKEPTSKTPAHQIVWMCN